MLKLFLKLSEKYSSAKVPSEEYEPGLIIMMAGNGGKRYEGCDSGRRVRHQDK